MSPPASVGELRPALLRCVAAGLVEARAADVPCAANAGASPLAHRNVELDPSSRLLLAELDGRPREKVTASFALRLTAAGLVAGPDGEVPPEAEVREAVALRLDDALASLAKRALLLR